MCHTPETYLNYIIEIILNVLFVIENMTLHRNQLRHIENSSERYVEEDFKQQQEIYFI